MIVKINVSEIKLFQPKKLEIVFETQDEYDIFRNIHYFNDSIPKLMKTDLGLHFTTEAIVHVMDTIRYAFLK